eukprot:CCRYP_009370-RB/>CCRYP_009370-RB protein AED:0.04 eAED:0.04 QI:263/1/1/1/0.8/0.66/6/1497/499
MPKKESYNFGNCFIACKKITNLELLVSVLLLAQCYPSECLGNSLYPKPIDANSWPDKFPAKSHCSKCGLCETKYVTHVVDACAFLEDGMKRNIDGLESIVHGRRRKPDAHEDTNGIADEARFGVMHSPMFLARGRDIPNAQWTGCVTGIAVSMLESKMVDAVVCIASGDDGVDGWSNPEPILARTVQDVMRGRGVKPALAPSLRVLDELRESPDVKKLLFCGVGCAVQAFRAIQGELGLEEVFVLGTNCADNSPTPEAARNFLRRSVPNLTDINTILGYEFSQDFRVHVKYTGDDKASSPVTYERLPYFCLPGDVAQFAIADSCLACFDYTNALADVVVGYMAAPIDSNNFRMHQSQQTITVRNTRGERMVQSAVNAGRLEIGAVASGAGNHEKFASATVSSDNIVQAMVGGKMQEQGMPRFIGEIMATIMTSVGPKGVNFARYSIDYHVLRNYLHVLDIWGENATMKKLPDYAQSVVNNYLETDETFKRIVSKIKSKK